MFNFLEAAREGAISSISRGQDKAVFEAKNPGDVQAALDYYYTRRELTDQVFDRLRDEATKADQSDVSFEGLVMIAPVMADYTHTLAAAIAGIREKGRSEAKQEG